MEVRVVNTLEKIPAHEWNALAGDTNPFLRHEFLHALELSGCVGAGTGWSPHYLVAYADDKLVGALPMYRKEHSYGEYVFDWAWANAYAQTGQQYYPKLVVAVPFTPATGARLLVGGDGDALRVKEALIESASAQMQETGMSSLHWLFTNEEDTRLLESHGFMRRVGCQFHWHNPGYRDFDDFLSTFASAKRKKIKRERRYVSEAGVEMEVITGKSITPEHCDTLYGFYQSTIHVHGAIPYITREFFHTLARTMPESVVFVFARHGTEYVAGAINLRGSDTLYGRYWGSRGNYHSLHFETCYYTAIDYCIAQGLKRFEAGAQGEHKLARGFVPTETYSMHRLSHPQFSRAVADFLAHERNGMESYMDELNDHLPFKTEPQETTSKI